MMLKLLAAVYLSMLRPLLASSSTIHISSMVLRFIMNFSTAITPHAGMFLRCIIIFLFNPNVPV